MVDDVLDMKAWINVELGLQKDNAQMKTDGNTVPNTSSIFTMDRKDSKRVLTVPQDIPGTRELSFSFGRQRLKQETSRLLFRKLQVCRRLSGFDPGRKNNPCLYMFVPKPYL